MSEDTTKYADIEDTLFSLIRSADMDQGNLLVLLSLVNMMGLINIISYRAGIRKKHETGQAGSAPEGGENEVIPEGISPPQGVPFDPAPLLSMLGGKHGPGLNPGHLEGLLKRFMGTPPVRQGGIDQEGRVNDAQPPGGEEGKSG
ncbi:MAG: hypothetical protein M1609_15315 [Firmicutes bacterium]|nr:hypothetical protein [Bacillota bacterium]MCL5058914.1 hypothetical protein [Actinomycetota bacterium]